ncbi:MAG: HEPN domain-containing protein [Anaerolineales bacterium]
MKPEVPEWIDKAEGDFLTAQREYRVRRLPNYDSVCFHVEQCVEKYMKARLVEAGIHFPKTHDLGHLLDLLNPVEPFWEPFRPNLNKVTYYAVEFRYPGEKADKEEARDALKICREFRRLARQSLGLPE